LKVMDIEDIIPHLNKMATLYLSNNKKKVGFLFIDEELPVSSEDNNEVYFVNVQKGRRLIHSMSHLDMKKLKEIREIIPLREILRIRSAK
jgi:hypothetical protein